MADDEQTITDYSTYKYLRWGVGKGKKLAVTKNAELPAILMETGVVSIGSNAYIVAGEPDAGEISRDIYKFNYETNEITTYKNIIPTNVDGAVRKDNRLRDLAVAVVGTNIYTFGGYNQQQELSPYLENVNYVCKFDTTTNTLTKLNTKLTKRYGGTSVSVGNKIYLFGGGEIISAKRNDISSIVCFDTVTLQVTKFTATLPKAEEYPTAFYVGNTIYVCQDNTTYIFDPNNDTLTKATIQFAEIPSPKNVVIGNKVWWFSVFYDECLYALDTTTNEVKYWTYSPKNLIEKHYTNDFIPAGITNYNSKFYSFAGMYYEDNDDIWSSNAVLQFEFKEDIDSLVYIKSVNKSKVKQVNTTPILPVREK